MRLSLLESVVINPERVETFVKSFLPDIQSQEARDWVVKRMRQIVMNSDEMYLRPLAAHEIPPNAPQYVQVAKERGEQVYRFSPETPTNAFPELLNAANILVDFFNGLYRQANEEIDATNQVAKQAKLNATKTLQKLGKMTWTQALAAAEQWAKAGQKSAQKMDKHGGEVIMQWPNGYYAIRFTDAETMKRDGLQLQNCLGRGYYWDEVKAGNQQVVAIRKPNDEAVVGMRFSANFGNIHECKGKNNQPITQVYEAYVVDLLHHLGTGGQNHDLSAAGINYNPQNGRYGTFKDIATVTYDEGGIKVYQAGAKGVAEQDGRDIFSFTLSNRSIAKGIFQFDVNERGGIARALRILNAIGLSGGGEMVNDMEKLGIFNKDGRWGDISTVGHRIGDYTYRGEPLVAWELGSREEGTIVLQGATQRVIYLIKGGEVVSASGSLGAEVELAVLNDAALRGDADFEARYAHMWGWAFVKDKGYVDITKTAKPVASFAEVGKDYQPAPTNPRKLPMYKVPGRALWLLETTTEQYATLRLNGSNGRLVFDDTRTSGVAPAAAAVRWMFEAGNARAIANPEKYGVANIPQGHDPMALAEFARDRADSGYLPLATFMGAHDSLEYLKNLKKLGLPKAKDQLEWVNSFLPKDPVEVSQGEDKSFGNLKLETFVLRLPDALMQMLKLELITEPKALNKAKAVRSNIENAVSKLFAKKAGVAYYTQDRSNEWPWSDLNNAIHAENVAAMRKVEEEKQRVLSQRGSVKDKFAALNTQQHLDQINNRRH